ncbi:MAG: ABC transporter substrate-binding protein, partial [Chloroflexota bacterium]
MKREITRRDFLRLSAVTAVGAVVAACAPPAPTATPVPPTKPPAPTAVPTIAVAPPVATSAPQPTTAPAAKYQEAPMLADLVKAGKLKPVDQRLPKKPWVVASYEGQGKYGGTWRRAFNGVSDRWGPTKLVDRGWAWFDKNLNLVPRVLDSWEVSKDGTTWTIKMREGLKWSDGVEHTSADYEWWYKNELTNKKVTPGTQTIWCDPDKTVAKFEVVDKYTAKFTYKKPKPMFIYNMTRGAQGGTTSAGPVTPSHYMKKWHIDTTDDKAALEAEVKKRGFASWEKFYVDRAQWWYLHTDRPHLGA